MIIGIEAHIKGINLIKRKSHCQIGFHTQPHYKKKKLERHKK